jgi:glycosyltransferase 2 family protein
MSEHVVSKKNQIRSLLLIIALMAVTIAVILRGYSVQELIKVIKSVHPFYMLAGIGMMLLYAGCQAMNFYIIMKELWQPAPFTHCIEYAYIGNYFGAITPGASGGQPAQIYYMNKDRIHIDISTITIFFMIFASQIVIVLIGAVLSVFRYPIVMQYATWFKYLLIAGTCVMLGLTAILSALMFSRRTVPFLLNLAFKLAMRLHLIKNPEVVKAKISVLIISYRDKSKMLLKHPDLFVKVFFITIIQWLAYCMVAYLVYLSLGYREHSALDLMTSQSLINIAVAAVPLPGSVGIAENSFLNVYGQFYSAKELPSAMILSRIINFYLPLIISFLVYLIAHQRTAKLKQQH